jgi:hypothetical protein
MALVLPGMTPAGDAAIPSFADLRAVDDRFFRRGISGAHRDELPEELHKAFWAQPDNRAAMNLLGYD